MVHYTTIINHQVLHDMSEAKKALLYIMLHGGVKAVQTEIDDEGCGAVFCTARIEVA